VSETADVEVRTASLFDIARIAGALGDAFVDDPVFVWAIPREDRRQVVLPGFFTVFTAAFQRHGHVHRTVDGSAAALWVPPGLVAIADHEGDAFAAALEEVCRPDAERVLTVGALLEEHHPHEPAWYLNFLGVEPASQSRGIGSALLTRVLDAADRDAAAACLDATGPRNRRLYEAHGFAATDEIQIPDGPPMWPMWRDPR
jgi:GNAT superfamily N-acetyltransferase